MSGALIVTAAMGAEDFAWLDRQRRAYFPPERNQLSAHLTMFHALPPRNTWLTSRIAPLEALVVIAA